MIGSKNVQKVSKSVMFSPGKKPPPIKRPQNVSKCSFCFVKVMLRKPKWGPKIKQRGRQNRQMVLALVLGPPWERSRRVSKQLTPKSHSLADFKNKLEGDQDDPFFCKHTHVLFSPNLTYRLRLVSPEALKRQEMQEIQFFQEIRIF